MADKHEYAVWATQLKEHRRALLELLLKEFPGVLTDKAKTKEVKKWRKRLGGG
jgi:hypothetical protein